MARHKTVGPDWPNETPCRLAFVGEAPSDEEMIAGRPLVGPSGRVFNQLLRTAGIVREECLVTNVFNEQLPGNDVRAWCAGAKEALTWEGYDLPPIDKGAYLRPEYFPHLARLADELAKASPSCVVPLGATALWALSGTSSITTCRGAVMGSSRLGVGYKLVPTLHPAHVIHEFKLFHVVASDLQKALAESAFPEIRYARRELWLQPTLADIRHFKKTYLDHADLISVDIETGWKQMTCIGFAADAGRSIVVPFWDLRKPSRSYWPSADHELEALELCAEILEGPAPKLFQNGPYDIYWLWDRYGIRARNYQHDTRLVHHALYPELPKDLGFMVACYGNQGPWKMMRPGGKEKRDE